MRKLKQFLIYFIGTGAGSGYAPFAPGTAGSLVGLILFYLIPFSSEAWLGIITLIFFVGVWTSSEIEKNHGTDPGLVVIDEVAGIWISLIFLPKTIPVFILGFLFFRIFDIWKPAPARQSQDLKAGWGIMIDDVIAGIYSNILLQIIVYSGII
ncbi:MAG: phosphatidylglycerophosphatase A [Calditrichaceae bacterium]